MHNIDSSKSSTCLGSQHGHQSPVMQNASGHSIRERIEDWVGFFFANLLTLLIAVMAIGLPVAMYGFAGKLDSSIEVAIGAVVLVPWLLLDLPFLLRLWHVMFRGQPPVAWTAAHRQRLAHPFLRPFIAGWWLCHFAFGAFFSLMTSRLDDNMNHPAGVVAFTTMLCMAYGFAANTYLIQGICAFTSNETARRMFWRCRILIDVGLGVAGMLAGWHIHG